MSKKSKKKSKNVGFINGFLNHLNNVIVKMFIVGFFANLITGNGKAERLEKQSLLLGTTSAEVAGRDKSIKRSLHKQYNKSSVMKVLRRLVNAVRSCRLNVFGAYLLTFGIYSTAVFFIKLLTGNGSLGLYILLEGELVSSAVMIAVSIPLLVTTRTVSVLLTESSMVRGIFEDTLGITEERFRPLSTVNGGQAYIVAVLLGILSGGLSYFVSSAVILLFIIGLAAAVVVMHFPEVGVLLSIFIAPLVGFFNYPTVVMIICVGITMLSYLVKVAIGTRLFKLRFADVMVIMFGAMLILGGIITFGGEQSLLSALTYGGLIAIYFLIVNLMNTEKWLERCTEMIALSSSIVALFGILSYGGGAMPTSWIDSDMFSEISNRAIATFSNPNSLATYLVLTAPFIWVRVGDKTAGKSVRILSLLGSALSLGCVVLTWSRGGWLGYLAAFLVYMLINHRYTLKYLLFGTLLMPVGYAFLPQNVAKRFLSIGSLADSSTYYRLFTWKGSLKMLADHFFGGIGVGTSAFHQIYPIYSYVGTEATLHSHNLFLEIAIELGVVGLLIFFIIMFCTARAGFNGIKKLSSDTSRVALSAGIAGLCAALVHGMVDYIWYNYRVFFMFWVAVAVVCAYSRVCCSSKDADLGMGNAGENEATLNIVFSEI